MVSGNTTRSLTKAWSRRDYAAMSETVNRQTERFLMDTATLRGLVGKLLAPAVHGLSPATARYRVLGFGSDTIRVQSLANQTRSSMSIVAVEQAITRGLLIVEDDSAA